MRVWGERVGRGGGDEGGKGWGGGEEDGGKDWPEDPRGQHCCYCYRIQLPLLLLLAYLSAQSSPGGV